MIKTVKVKKKLRLDELIKYVWDNQLYPNVCFIEGGGRASVIFGNDGSIEFGEYSYGTFRKNDTFTVEVEEEINNKTIFKSVVGVLNNDEIMLTNTHTTIEGIQDRYGSMKEIYAVIGGKLELIWEADCVEL